MSQLVWKGAPGNVIAHGAKGMYSIQSLTSGQHVLQGLDGDARKALPFLGEAFPTLVAAKNRAWAIEGEQ